MSDDKQLEEAQNRLAWRAPKERGTAIIVELLFLTLALAFILLIN
jgi:hypothetical protein